MSSTEEDPHPTCKYCRGNECAKDNQCDFCALWSDEQWAKFEQRGTYSKKKKHKSTSSKDSSSNPELLSATSLFQTPTRSVPPPTPGSAFKTSVDLRLSAQDEKLTQQANQLNQMMELLQTVAQRQTVPVPSRDPFMDSTSALSVDPTTLAPSITIKTEPNEEIIEIDSADEHIAQTSASLPVLEPEIVIHAPENELFSELDSGIPAQLLTGDNTDAPHTSNSEDRRQVLYTETDTSRISENRPAVDTVYLHTEQSDQHKNAENKGHSSHDRRSRSRDSKYDRNYSQDRYYNRNYRQSRYSDYEYYNQPHNRRYRDSDGPSDRNRDRHYDSRFTDRPTDSDRDRRYDTDRDRRHDTDRDYDRYRDRHRQYSYRSYSPYRSRSPIYRIDREEHENNSNFNRSENRNVRDKDKVNKISAVQSSDNSFEQNQASPDRSVFIIDRSVVESNDIPPAPTVNNDGQIQPSIIQEDKTNFIKYQEVIGWIKETFPDTDMSIPTDKLKPRSMVETMYDCPPQEPIEKLSLPWSSGCLDVLGDVQKIVRGEGSNRNNQVLKKNKMIPPFEFPVRFYHTKNVTKIEAKTLNPAFEELIPSSSRSSLRKPNVEISIDDVISNETSALKSLLVSSSLDWQLATAASRLHKLMDDNPFMQELQSISEAISSIQQPSPQIQSIGSRLNKLLEDNLPSQEIQKVSRIILSAGKSTTQLQRESAISHANAILRRRDSILSLLPSQVPDSQVMALRASSFENHELFDSNVITQVTDTLQSTLQREANLQAVGKSSFKKVLKQNPKVTVTVPSSNQSFSKESTSRRAFSRSSPVRPAAGKGRGRGKRTGRRGTD